jgi:hypothetical protein
VQNLFLKPFAYRIVWLALGIEAGGIAVAQENSSADAENTAAPVAAALPATVSVPHLAPGVTDIAKLAQAKVGDSLILAYIENSGTVYNLDANQIIYLRQSGVSEAVLSAMLNQRQKYMESAARMAPPTVPVPTTPPPAAYSSSAYYSQAPPDYVQPQPIEAPVSTVYVIPYEGTWPSYGCYNYSPYYSYYCAPFSYACYGGFVHNHGFHPHESGFRFQASASHQFGARGGFHSAGRQFQPRH